MNLFNKFLMFYQPTMWVDNTSASLLHFLIRNQGLSKFVNKLHFELKNDPRWNLDYPCSRLLNKFKTKTADTFYLCTQTYLLEEPISSRRMT